MQPTDETSYLYKFSGKYRNPHTANAGYMILITDRQHSIENSNEGPFKVSESPRTVRQLIVGSEYCVANVPTPDVYRSNLTDYRKGDDSVGSKLIEALSEGFCTCEYPNIGGL